MRYDRIRLRIRNTAGSGTLLAARPENRAAHRHGLLQAQARLGPRHHCHRADNRLDTLQKKRLTIKKKSLQFITERTKELRKKNVKRQVEKKLCKSNKVLLP